MKQLFRAMAVLVMATPLLLFAQGPDAQFVEIYKLIQQGDTLAATGQLRTAGERYLEAQKALKQLQTANPSWNERVVKFRLNYLAEKLSVLAPQLPKGTNAPQPAAQKTPSAPAPDRDLDALNQQIRALQADKRLLEAKLREALSAQPAAADPRELKKAEEQLRMLQKENEILRVTLQKQSRALKTPDSSGLEQTKKALAEANLKLQQQMAATTTLELEKKALEARLQSLNNRPPPSPAKPKTPSQPSPGFEPPPAKPSKASVESSLAAKKQAERIKQLSLENQVLQKKLEKAVFPPEVASLQSENEKLKKQVDTVRATVKPAASEQKLAQQLLSMKAELDSQKSALNVLRSEKAALERRLKESASKASPTLSPRSESQNPAPRMASKIQGDRGESERLKRLEKEKEDLQRKLKAANEQLVAKDSKAQKKSPPPAQDAGKLAAKLAVLESKKVPYTEEELALFKAPQKSAALREVKGSPGNPSKATATIQLAENTTPAVPAKPPPNTDSTESPSMRAPDAAKSGKRSLRDLPPGAGPLVAEAQRAFYAKRYDEAEQKYQQALRLDDKSVFLLANLATIQLEQNRLTEAEVSLKKALAEDPQDAFSLSLFGILKFRQNKFDEALTALSEAVKLDPQNPETQNYLGVTLSQKGMREPAETALRKAIQLAPGYPSAHYNLAVVYATQQPPYKELARLHYQKAIASGHPKNPELEKLFEENSASPESK